MFFQGTHQFRYGTTRNVHVQAQYTTMYSRCSLAYCRPSS